MSYEKLIVVLTGLRKAVLRHVALPGVGSMALRAAIQDGHLVLKNGDGREPLLDRIVGGILLKCDALGRALDAAEERSADIGHVKPVTQMCCALEQSIGDLLPHLRIRARPSLQRLDDAGRAIARHAPYGEPD